MGDLLLSARLQLLQIRPDVYDMNVVKVTRECLPSHSDGQAARQGCAAAAGVGANLIVQGVVLQLIGLHVVPAIPEFPVCQGVALQRLACLKNLQTCKSSCKHRDNVIRAAVQKAESIGEQA